MFKKIQHAYKSSSGLLPEILDELNFVDLCDLNLDERDRELKAKMDKMDCLADDFFITLGVMYVFDKRGVDNSDDYIYCIINSGGRHLPLIAYFLKTRGIDPHFVLPRYRDDEWFHKLDATKSFLNLVEKYSDIEIEPRGVSSLFCAHQRFDKTEWMPDEKELINLGIKRVVLLVEEGRGLNYALKTHSEFRLGMYTLDKEIYDIEARLNARDRKKILRFAKDDKLNLLAEATGKSKSEIKRALRSFKL
jgi:hypothetical protein